MYPTIVRIFMPNWKKVITSGSDALLNSVKSRNEIEVSGSLRLSSQIEDNNFSTGSDGQFLVKESGSLVWGSLVGDIYTDHTYYNVLADEGTKQAGQVSWDTDRESLHTYLKQDLAIHIGRDTAILVTNQSGTDIPKGTIVQFAGTLGASGRLLVSPFDASSSGNPDYVIGITLEEIPNGSTGNVLERGQITKIDTSIWPDGTLLYADPVNVGQLTSTIPLAPNFAVLVAAVVHSSSNSGILEVRLSIPSNLHNDSKVYIDEASLVTGQELSYDAGQGYWTNISTSYRLQVSGSTSYTLAHNLNEEYPIVQIYSAGLQIIPSAVATLDANTIRVDFNRTTSAMVVVKK